MSSSSLVAGSGCWSEERFIDDKYIDLLIDCDGWIGAPPPGGAGIHVFHVTTTIIFNT